MQAMLFALLKQYILNRRTCRKQFDGEKFFTNGPKQFHSHKIPLCATELFTILPYFMTFVVTIPILKVKNY